MAKIPLTIDPNYCRTWGFWEGVRELIQNAKDADEWDSYPMTVQHMPRTDKLIISNKDVALPAAQLLLLGASSKRGSGQRGQFGEGFALGCLALSRAGHPMTIYNGDEVWRPEVAKAEDGPFAGHDLLVFTTRKLQSMRGEFSVEIENISKEVWENTLPLFLFLSPPKPDDIVETNGGAVLIGDQYKGKLFSKGIFVNTIDDLACGYDVHHIELDRDRRFTNEWDLKWRLGEILTEAHAKDPEKFAPRIYKMAKENKREVQELHYKADDKLLKALRREYEAEHGADVVPVRDMVQSRQLELCGAKTAVVNRTLQELLAKSGLDAEKVKERLENTVKEILPWSALTEEEAAAVTNVVEKLTKEYNIVHFNNETLSAKVLDLDKKIGIARWVLTRPAKYLISEVIRCEANRRGVGTDELYAELLSNIIAPPPVAPPTEVASESELQFPS